MTTPPPIALTRLEIRNFRGIESLDLNFCRPDGQPNSLVVLAGPNGSGKTAVLEAGLMAVGGSDLITGSQGRKAIGRGAVDYSITASGRDVNSNPLGWSKILSSGHRTAEYPQPPHWYFSSWRSPGMIGPVPVSIGRSGRKPLKTDHNRLKNIKRALVDAAAIKDFRSSRKKLRASSYDEWIKALNGAWLKFYPDETGEFLVDFVMGPDGEAAEGFDIFLSRPDGFALEIEALSAGQLELFLFLMALILNDGNQGIVFIDEPELHLDPQWHRLVVQTLCELQPRAQFIVATHSPEIYDAARSYERHFLVSEDDPRAHLWLEVGRSHARG